MGWLLPQCLVSVPSWITRAFTTGVLSCEMPTRKLIRRYRVVFVGVVAVLLAALMFLLWYWYQLSLVPPERML